MNSLVEWVRGLIAMIGSVLKSRKFWAAVAGTIAAFQTGGDPQEIALAIAAVWIAYIFGTAYEDGQQKRGGAG